MVKNIEVAKEFAGNCDNMNGNNMFIQDKTIFSYGHHFPIAIKLDNGTYLVNKNKRSISTSTHQNYVKRAIEGSEIILMDTRKLIEVYNSGITSMKELIAENIIQVKGGFNG